jgi:hypothetical protein
LGWEAVNAAREQADIAGEHMESAEAAMDAAERAAEKSQSWAAGGTDTREGEDVNNAYHWAMIAISGAGLPFLAPYMPSHQPIGGLWFDNSGEQPWGGEGNIVILGGAWYADEEPPDGSYTQWIDPDN